MNRTRLMSIMSGIDRSAAGHMTRLGLSCIEPLYRGIVMSRNRLFDSGLRSARKLPRKVISVGNVTTGGTGKTPLVIELARRLTTMNVELAVLLRGYKSGSGGSDEALEVEGELGSAIPVEADPNRKAAASRVIDTHPDVEVFLLDDGFQHRQVHRDLDLVLIEARQPFGFDHVLPRGLLREPRGNLKRADAVIITHADRVSPEELSQTDQTIVDLTGRRPLGHAAHRWEGYRDHADQRRQSDLLRQATVIGVCGIGQPDMFKASLQDHVGQLSKFVALADHHSYRREQLISMLEASRTAGCEVAVTTEKDWVKWRSLIRPESLPIPVYRPVLKIHLLDGSEALDELLRRCLSQLDVD